MKTSLSKTNSQVIRHEKPQRDEPNQKNSEYINNLRLLLLLREENQASLQAIQKLKTKIDIHKQSFGQVNEILHFSKMSADMDILRVVLAQKSIHSNQEAHDRGQEGEINVDCSHYGSLWTHFGIRGSSNEDEVQNFNYESYIQQQMPRREIESANARMTHVLENVENLLAAFQPYSSSTEAM